MKKCASCKSRKALYVIGDCYHRAAKGKVVCGSHQCWSQQTLGYPAEGRLIVAKKSKETV